MLPDLVTTEAGALTGVSISIIVSMKNVRIAIPKKYGGIYIGADNNVIKMDNCTVTGVGAGKAGADAYYVWARFVYKFVMDQCTIEGLNPGTKSWVNLGAQGSTVKDGWFEEDGGDVSTLAPTYFIEALGGTVGLDIDHPEFIRASTTANGRPRLIKLNGNSHGVTITNPRAKMIDNLFGGGTWLETNHVDLGGNSNRSITVLGRGQIVDSVGTNYDLQYSNVPSSAAFLASAAALDTLKVNRLQLNPTTFANLGTPTNGYVFYCSDCTKATPCAGSGTGAFAVRRAGTWDCNP